MYKVTPSIAQDNEPTASVTSLIQQISDKRHRVLIPRLKALLLPHEGSTFAYVVLPKNMAGAVLPQIEKHLTPLLYLAAVGVVLWGLSMTEVLPPQCSLFSLFGMPLMLSYLLTFDVKIVRIVLKTFEFRYMLANLLVEYCALAMLLYPHSKLLSITWVVTFPAHLVQLLSDATHSTFRTKSKFLLKGIILICTTSFILLISVYFNLLPITDQAYTLYNGSISYNLSNIFITVNMNLMLFNMKQIFMLHRFPDWLGSLISYVKVDYVGKREYRKLIKGSEDEEGRPEDAIGGGLGA